MISTKQIEAENYLLKLLSYRIRSEKEARDKLLNKGYEEDIINKVIVKAKDLKLIDDEEFTKRFIHDKLILGKKSKLEIKAGLKKFGIDEEIIEEELNKISSEDEKNVIEDLIKKKYKELNDNNKIINYLIRRGFDKNIIEEVIDECKNRK